MHETLDCSDSGIQRCAQIVKDGGVVVFPTDTVYGIGCDPHNDAAVRRVFSIKDREEKKPLPVLVGSVDDAEKIVTLGQKGRALAERLWPGALTIVAPLKDV
ncbi:MAG TPA: Sua5/YciO/YrdC/YwlC family protein, partial [Nitrososphaera sp.]